MKRGAAARGWDAWRAAEALKELRERKNRLDHSMEVNELSVGHEQDRLGSLGAS